MKDRIEIKKVAKIEPKKNKNGEVKYVEVEYIKFYLHCDMGVLWMFDKPFSIGVYEYFRDNVSVTELHTYRYTCNKKLNKIVDRLPAHIKYVKQLAIEEREHAKEREVGRYDSNEDYEMAA